MIELALDQGDEDLSTVSIGKLFLQAASMLGAFKSYCTRQVIGAFISYCTRQVIMEHSNPTALDR